MAEETWGATSSIAPARVNFGAPTCTKLTSSRHSVIRSLCFQHPTPSHCDRTRLQCVGALSLAGQSLRSSRPLYSPVEYSALVNVLQQWPSKIDCRQAFDRANSDQHYCSMTAPLECRFLFGPGAWLLGVFLTAATRCLGGPTHEMVWGFSSSPKRPTVSTEEPPGWVVLGTVAPFSSLIHRHGPTRRLPNWERPSEYPHCRRPR